jgi:1,4-alpha-glucan branching enzyme
MLKKNYSKSGSVCRVTFELPLEAKAKKVALCGDFNQWKPNANPMIKRKDGRWSTTISLEAGNNYRFRYLIDNESWENDWAPDGYLPNSFGSDDSLIKV